MRVGVGISLFRGFLYENSAKRGNVIEQLKRTGVREKI